MRTVIPGKKRFRYTFLITSYCINNFHSYENHRQKPLYRHRLDCVAAFIHYRLLCILRFLP
ncbi:MAG: hypothetical protein AVDCRST_MAG56-3988 [uncultured Cytophagales bacterium]|uniref:Uncharacterized protein n=1 Tax=uncultured Cytophagales bacterium TaxID=158755 RepID=A0A6J4JQE9_9SPHI|nr:MAG: hypothetical protein AVDCRST_MAG56-3988 [uncultured Cytophagales bacterium]